MNETHEERRDRLNSFVTDERCDASRLQLTDAFLTEFERNCADLPPQAAWGATVAGLIKATTLAWMTVPPREGASEDELRAALHTIIDGDWEDLRPTAAEFDLWPTIYSDARERAA